MPCQVRFVSFAVAVLVSCFPFGSARAQTVSGSHARPLVTQNIDEGKLVELHGNIRPEAKVENDRGAVDDDLLLEHVLLQLRRPAEKEEDLQEFLEDLQTEGSPNFHRWISAHEFGERFGPSDQDLDKITDWLEQHHFQINVVYPSGMVIDFTGTAGQVQKAFHTEIHQIDVKGEKHVANMSNPQIPAALSSLVVGIVSLHNFSPHAMHQMHRAWNQFTFPDPLGGTNFALAPADLATIYNLNPLFNAGNSGQGQTIALIEDTDVFTLSDWNSFRSAFGLSRYSAGTITAIHPAAPSGPNNCKIPGVIAPNDAEAILDAEWASAAAPSAAIKMVSCADTTSTFGGLIAVQNLINAKSAPPAIMSISYGQCEAVNGAAANAAYNAAYQQAVARGVSVFVAAGDSGAAGCDNSVSEATSGIAVNAFASTPYNVAVGGTDFSDTYSSTNSSYWNSANTPTFGSALSYIPEIPWNDSCAGALVSSFEGFSPTYGSTSLCNDPNLGPYLQTTVAGGGGPSACATGTPSTSGVVSGTCKGWPKPSWQSVLGNPHDGVRDTPDVSLFAADGLWGHSYVFCWSDTVNGGAACTGSPSGWTQAGGTSFASPIMAGIQALINQRAGARQGNPNPTYYKLAATEYGLAGNSSCNSSNGVSVSNACVFYDITQGDIDVNCTGIHNCYLPSGSVGVLSTSINSFAPAYGTTTGWDFASGIGSVNATNLVNDWPGVTPIQGFLLSASPSTLNIAQGATGASTITLTPQGGFSGTVSLSASGLPSGVTPSFSTNPAAASSSLTLTANGTATTGTVTLTVTGTSGSLTNTTTISLTVTAAVVPNFALSASPASLVISQGTSGVSTISVTPQNGFSSGVSLSAPVLPPGVSASFSPNPATATSTLTLTASSTAATGAATVTITGTSGSLTNTATVALTVNPATNFPPGWSDLDIGSVGVVGSASYANGTFTVNGAGTSVWSNADGFHFAYQALSGDGTIVARVASLTPSSTAGVMIRETLNTSSMEVFSAYYNQNMYMNYRTSTGGGTSQAVGGGATLPNWVKVVRSGSTFSGWTSLDGVNWVQLGTSQTINMGQNVYIGLGVTSNSTSTLATATFDSVSINSTAAPAPVITGVSATTGNTGSQVVISGTGFGASQSGSMVTLNAAQVTVNAWSDTSLTITIPSAAASGPLVVSVAPSMNASNPVTFTVTAQPLPAGWLDQDIGSVGVAGSATYASGTLTVKGAGASVWGTADGFHFAFQALTGDRTIIARVASLTPSSTAGVMIRETLNPGSTELFSAYYNQNMYMNYRTSTGGSTSQAVGGSATLPYWVKVVRSGSTLSGYSSSDGTNWVQLGTSQTINMAQTVYIGLGVTSNSTSTLATATFDNVAINTNVAPPPNFALSASPSSLTIMQGTSGMSTISVAPLNGFSSGVSLSASGLPSGVTPSFSANPATASSSLTLTANGAATTGTVTVTITGTSGSLTNTTTISLTITAAVVPNFALSASPSILSVVQGASGTSIITVTPQNGFSGSVSLSAPGLPIDVSASFSPNPTTATSTLTLTASSTATTGTVTVTITGVSGSLTNTTTISLTVSAATSSTLPSVWSDLDIGSVGVVGSASYANGTFTVNGAGTSVWSTADGFHFAYQALPGDGTIVARVASLTPSSTAGVMIRETLNASSTEVFSAYYGQKIYMNYRAGTGGSTGQAIGGSVSLPYWVKVVRSGNTLSGYSSLDGVNWAQLGTNQTISMAQTVYIGLGVTSGSTSTLATATFDSVSINSTAAPAPVITSVSATTGNIGSQVAISGTGFGAQNGSIVTLNGAQVTINAWTDTSITIAIPSGATSGPLVVSSAPSMNASNPVTFTVTSQPLPTGWLNQDIGSVGVAGSATYANGTFTVNGAGTSVWSTADGFHFAYQALSGDGTIVARVASLTPSSTAGVMIRETLNPSSTELFSAYYNQNMYMNYRLSTGGNTGQAIGGSAALPYWVKVVRSGSTLSGYSSSDGVNWAQLGTSQTISMAQTVYIGLGVTSNSTSTLATASFDIVASQ
jgi:subtilase family serine protease